MKGKGTKYGEWQKKAILGGECKRCHKVFNRLTVDHIIPQVLCRELNAFEYIYDNEENFNLICMSCNAYKNSKIDITDPVSVKILKEIVNRL